MTDVSKKIWLVTGASAGFGRALADEIIARGDCVIATAREKSAVAELEKSHPERVLALALDVTKDGQITEAVRMAEARFGRIDVLINNAGYGFLSGVEEASDAEVRAQFEVNVFGLAAITRAVLPIMRRQQAGHIVNISSVAGVCGLAGSGYYSASKFAVEGFSEALAQEIEPFGIRVLIVEPGPFRTEFFGRSMARPANPISEYQNTADLRARFDRTNGKQVGDPKRGAAAIVDAVTSSSPQLRLVLGQMAFDMACKALDARIKDVEKSRTIASQVDFPSA